MKKTLISGKVTIDAPKQKVWDALADFGNVQAMSPNIIISYLTSDQESGVGTQRHCDFALMGAEVEERIVDWEEGKRLKIDIYECKKLPMVTAMEAEFILEESGEQTILTGHFHYGMKNALGGLLNSILMKKMNAKTWAQFLAGIKHHLETGEMVNKKTVLDLSKVSM